MSSHSPEHRTWALSTEHRGVRVPIGHLRAQHFPAEEGAQEASVTWTLELANRGGNTQPLSVEKEVALGTDARTPAVW